MADDSDDVYLVHPVQPCEGLKKGDIFIIDGGAEPDTDDRPEPHDCERCGHLCDCTRDEDGHCQVCGECEGMTA